MPWYSTTVSFFLTFWLSFVRLAEHFASRIQTTPVPLIALPVTSPTPSISFLTAARGFNQQFIIPPLTSIYSVLHNLLLQIAWHIPMYMRQITKALEQIRIFILAALASGLLYLAKAMHHTSERPMWNANGYGDTKPSVEIHIRESRSVDPPRSPHPAWQGYQNNAGFGYAPLPSQSSVNLVQTAVLDSNDSVTNLSTPTSEVPLSSDSNWGLTPSDSFLGSESSVNSHSSLVTPSQSPDQTFFKGLELACKGVDDGNMDITDGFLDQTISLEAIMEERRRIKQIATKLGAESTTSINSFGQIERMFEDTYGKAASLTANEFFTSLGKRGMAPPAPITVFSASVSYDASLRSRLSRRLNALVSADNSANSSFEVICPNNTLVEEDITAATDIGNRLLDLSSLSSADNSMILEDVSSPVSDRSSVHLSAGFLSSQENLMDDDASLILAYRDSFTRASILLSPQESVLSQYSQESALEYSPALTSSASSPFYDALSPVTPDADALLPGSRANSSRDTSPSQHMSLKKPAPSDRVSSGLGIDIKTPSPSLLSSVIPSPTISSELRSTVSEISIPSIIVSSVSDDTDSSPDLDISIFTSDTSDKRRQIESPRNTNTHRSMPAVEYNFPIIRDSTRSKSVSVTSSCRSPSRTSLRDSVSRRVGLRGSAPRYRFSTPPGAALDILSDSPLPDAAPAEDRRVKLHGNAPRQRYAATLSPPAPSSTALLVARAAHDARERAAILERHRGRAEFFAQRDAAHGPGLRPLLLPMSVAARERAIEGRRSVSPTRFWGMPF